MRAWLDRLRNRLDGVRERADRRRSTGRSAARRSWKDRPSVGHGAEKNRRSRWGRADTGTGGCAFCTAIRTWLVALVRRLLQAVYAAGRRLRSLKPPPEGPHAAPARHCPRGTFRKRAYAGSCTRHFEVHVPHGCNGRSAMPLLMVLHGCGQTHADIRRISNFDALADREGFIVVYPYVTAQSVLRMRNCWGWWLPTEIRPGAGEVEDLWQIVEQVQKDLPVDENRIHVAGLSSGGGMAVAAMVAHAGRFASGAVVAGLPYAESSRALSPGGAARFNAVDKTVGAMRSVLGPNGRPSPVLVVHSHDDTVVDVEAARRIRDSWAHCYGVDTSRPGSRKAGVSRGTAWVHHVYREARTRSAVETLFLEGPDHGWYGGAPGRFSYPDAPDVSERIWRFLKRHPRHGRLRRRAPLRRFEKAG